jgi:hypothetical protein
VLRTELPVTACSSPTRHIAAAQDEGRLLSSVAAAEEPGLEPEMAVKRKLSGKSSWQPCMRGTRSRGKIADLMRGRVCSRV